MLMMLDEMIIFLSSSTGWSRSVFSKTPLEESPGSIERAAR